MLRKIIAVLTIGFLPLGCLIDSGKSLPEPRVVSTFNAEVISMTNRKVEFSITCIVPEPCWEFVRSEQTISGPDVYVQAFARRATDDMCIQVISTIKANISVSVPSAGNYRFYFWRSDTSSFDVAVAVQ